MTKTVNQLPIVTPGEGILGGVLAVAALTNPAGAAVPVVLGLAEAGFYLLRRTPGFKEWAESHLEGLEDAEGTFNALLRHTFTRLPVPPAGVLLLPAEGETGRGYDPELASQASVKPRNGGTGFGNALLSAFGEDDPFERAARKVSSNIETSRRRPADDEVKPGRPSQGARTRKLPAVEVDEDTWLNENNGAPKALA